MLIFLPPIFLPSRRTAIKLRETGDRRLWLGPLLFAAVPETGHNNLQTPVRRGSPGPAGEPFRDGLCPFYAAPAMAGRIWVFPLQDGARLL
jgi:hypothetical protein